VASADVRDDGVAVVLFTSGTTGDAKRVELTHAALRVNAQYFAHEAMRLRPDDVLFGSVPLSHVFGMTACMNGAVAAGASLALLRRFEPRAALELIERERVTIFLGVPSMCVALLAASAETGLAPQMRLAHVGGAPLPVETSRAFEERFGCEVYEGYGLTEVGGTATTNHVGRPRRHGSVGTPAAGGEVRLDERTGEVLLRTPTMMRGVDGWLATGDIGRLDEDGYLFLVGRLKDVILRGGYTVHPRELEEVLVEHPAVREAVVVGVPDERLGEDIVAVVVPAGDCDPDAVREWMRTRVAAYKYPRRVIVVDDLPRGPSGKVLRRAIDVPTTMPPI
jgi:long-chain acyl-CoA synthetase